MEIDEFDIVCNKQNLQYYSFLREALETNELSYWIGNPSVQITNGVIYLDSSISIESSSISQLDSFQTYLAAYSDLIKATIPIQSSQNSNILLMVGISNKKSPIEILNRFAQYYDDIIQTKVLKTPHFCYYGILFMFRDHNKAYNFYLQEFGQQFSSLEVQRILLRWVDSATIFSTGVKETEVKKLLYLKGLPVEGQKVPAKLLFEKQTRAINNSPKKKQNKDNSENTCPICFQQIQGNYVVSILCQHSFHFKCLSQWNENICPMCRYHQQPPLISFCERCNQCEGLWICLICGARLCCGSTHDILGEQSHIYAHYLETKHRLSIEAETKFIFDAQQPAFLHNMFYQEIDQPKEKKTKKGKIGQKISDYEQNISEQMQRQRHYFQESLGRQRKKQKQELKQKKKKLAELEANIIELDLQLEQSEKQSKELDQKHIYLQKQKNIIGQLQKMWRGKAKEKKDMVKSQENKVNDEIMMLNMKIKERQEELKDYLKDYELRQKLKKNLNGQKVQNQLFLGTENKKKRK